MKLLEFLFFSKWKTINILCVGILVWFYDIPGVDELNFALYTQTHTHTCSINTHGLAFQKNNTTTTIQYNSCRYTPIL